MPSRERASAFAALADPTRRRILKILRAGSKTAGEIADAFQLTKPTISHHFAVLRAAGLVRAERRGTSNVYTLQTNVMRLLRPGARAALMGRGPLRRAALGSAARVQRRRGQGHFPGGGARRAAPRALTPSHSPTKIVLALTGFLFVALGLILPKTWRNRVLGVRTPWTLARDESWARTHRVAGYSFVAGGILGGTAGAAGGLGGTTVSVMAFLAAAVVPPIYSLVIARPV